MAIVPLDADDPETLVDLPTVFVPLDPNRSTNEQRMLHALESIATYTGFLVHKELNREFLFPSRNSSE